MHVDLCLAIIREQSLFFRKAVNANRTLISPQR